MATFQKYNRSFISQVICRIDFFDSIDQNEIFNSKVIKKIPQIFSNREKDQIIRFNTIDLKDMNNSKSDIQSHFFEGIQQTYTTSDEKNKIIISNKYIIAEFNSYETFEILYDSIEPMLKELSKIRRFTVARTGLRFINIFDSEKIKIKKKYFIGPVSNALKVIIEDPESKLVPIRSMHLTEYRLENINLNFRFGLYNKGYPNVIKNNDFILDFDCFSTERFQNYEEVLRMITTGHDNIQLLFENTITDELRMVMNHE